MGGYDCKERKPEKEKKKDKYMCKGRGDRGWGLGKWARPNGSETLHERKTNPASKTKRNKKREEKKSPFGAALVLTYHPYIY